MTTSETCARDLPKQQVGAKFGHLELIRLSHRSKAGVYWLCRCDCGTEKTISWNGIRDRAILSCGCYAKSESSKRWFRHGCSKTPLFATWQRMINRCLPTYEDSHLYYERGICVCERWRMSFEHFKADMGERPSDKHSIDRINNDGNYEPGNCRWATCQEQNRNTRSNRLLTYNGKTQCMAAWASEVGIKVATLHTRFRLGWSVGDALTRPVIELCRNGNSRNV